MAVNFETPNIYLTELAGQKAVNAGIEAIGTDPEVIGHMMNGVSLLLEGLPKSADDLAIVMRWQHPGMADQPDPVFHEAPSSQLYVPVSRLSQPGSLVGGTVLKDSIGAAHPAVAEMTVKRWWGFPRFGARLAHGLIDLAARADTQKNPLDTDMLALLGHTIVGLGFYAPGSPKPIHLRVADSEWQQP